MQNMQQNPNVWSVESGNWKTLRLVAEMRCQWEVFTMPTKLLRQILSSLNHCTTSLEQGPNLFLLMHVKPEYDSANDVNTSLHQYIKAEFI